MLNKSVQAYGKHLIIDLYQAKNLNDINLMRQVVEQIVEITGATLLSDDFHHFNPQGVTGIACLAESHISVHTWPENGYAAFDFFLCGDSDPELAIDILKQHFGGIAITQLIYRGEHNK